MIVFTVNDLQQNKLTRFEAEELSFVLEVIEVSNILKASIKCKERTFGSAVVVAWG